MSHGYFVTGTDTDVGKTWVALGLLTALEQKGHSTLAMKPVACGCQPGNGGYRNDDAIKLQQQASVSIPYETVNPYAFPAPIAPHLAVRETGQEIDLHYIKQIYEQQKNKADYVVIEGVGGWLVPLNARHTTADMVKLLQLPVILVVGIRLGCLNHALLTAAAIRHEGIRLAGWVANCIDKNCLETENNIGALRERINAPLLGVVPCLERFDIRAIGDCLDIEKLI
jgi:dethiobiotin synthetase